MLAEAAGARAAVELVMELRPDVVLLDLHMPALIKDEVTHGGWCRTFPV
ncbi:hypothetical protein [Arthrobacter sp. lap29]|nr:hypothetical protein [Arthrobacter sp. lap29]